MAATTIKLEGPILKEIAAVKPRGQTLTAFVRESLEREIRQRKLYEAAHSYRALMEQSSEDADWESANLGQPVTKGSRK